MRLAICFLIVQFFAQAYGVEVSAFRGVHQPPHPSMKIDNSTCTAKHIADVGHSYLENTIDGIRASFEMGATVGHFNIHRTSDGKIVVFHDWTVDCRTNGTGQTNQLTFAYLRSLDVGYGYAKFDKNGRAYYPLRGKGQRMPTVTEILKAFPTRTFMVFAKESSDTTAVALANELILLPEEDQRRIQFIGEQASTLLEKAPAVGIFNTPQNIKKCLMQSLIVGWTGYIPKVCRNRSIAAPLSLFKKYFGTKRAKKLIQKMKESETNFWLIEVNSKEDWNYAMQLKPYGIGTYRMDLITPLIEE